LPPIHPSSHDGNQINPSAFEWSIPSDRPKTLASEKLAAAPYIVDARESVIVLVAPLPERRADNAQSRILGESCNQQPKVIGLKRHIGIKIPYDVEICTPQPFIGSVEGVCLSGEVPLRSSRHPQ